MVQPPVHGGGPPPERGRGRGQRPPARGLPRELQPRVPPRETGRAHGRASRPDDPHRPERDRQGGPQPRPERPVPARILSGDGAVRAPAGGGTRDGSRERTDRHGPPVRGVRFDPLRRIDRGGAADVPVRGGVGGGEDGGPPRPRPEDPRGPHPPPPRPDRRPPLPPRPPRQPLA